MRIMVTNEAIYQMGCENIVTFLANKTVKYEFFCIAPYTIRLKLFKLKGKSANSDIQTGAHMDTNLKIHDFYRQICKSIELGKAFDALMNITKKRSD